MNKTKLEKALNYAEKSLEFENPSVSKEQINLVKDNLKGNITHKEFIKGTIKLTTK